MEFNGTSRDTVGIAGFSKSIAPYTSLAFNKSGNPYIAYQDTRIAFKATVKEFNDTILPVRLLAFSGERIKDIAALTWKTASEQNNAYFEVQRSNDGVNFNQIGQVSGHGTTNLPEQYNFTDPHPELNGINYYRLDQVDYDGHMTFSNTIALRFDGGPLTYQLYPNPVSHTLYLNIPVTEDRKSIEVYGSDGKLLMTRIISTPSNKIGLDVSGLSSGTYLLKITSANGSNTALKFIKQ